MYKTFYTAGFLEDDVLSILDIAEEYSETFRPIEYDTPEGVKEHWEQNKPRFRYSYLKGQDKVLKITIQIEEVGDLM